MSVVVQRCPNCGTTQARPGECEACHDADVRWFCPNHAPGRWLDAPSCAACGATAERDPAARRPTPPPPVPPHLRRESPGTPGTPGAPPGRSRRAPRVTDTRSAPLPPRRPIESPPRDPSPRPTREEPRWEEPPRATPGATPLEELDPYAARRGRDIAGPDWRPTYPPAEPPAEPRGPELRVPVRALSFSLFGCLGRLVATAITLVLLVIAAIVFLWFFGPSAIRTSAVDFGRQVGVVAGMPAQTEAGIAAFRDGDYPRAERELREAAQAYPRSGVALVYLARIQRMRGDDARAEEPLAEAIRREPALASAHRELGGLHLARAQRRGLGDDPSAAAGDMATAELHLARAVALDPADRAARGYHACALATLGRTADALREQAQAGLGPWSSCVVERTR